MSVGGAAAVAVDRYSINGQRELASASLPARARRHSATSRRRAAPTPKRLLAHADRPTAGGGRLSARQLAGPDSTRLGSTRCNRPLSWHYARSDLTETNERARDATMRLEFKLFPSLLLLLLSAAASCTGWLASQLANQRTIEPASRRANHQSGRVGARLAPSALRDLRSLGGRRRPRLPTRKVHASAPVDFGRAQWQVSHQRAPEPPMSPAACSLSIDQSIWQLARRRAPTRPGRLLMSWRRLGGAAPGRGPGSCAAHAPAPPAR